MKHVKVGVVQATPALFNLPKSIDIAIDWIEKGARAGCELLLFPEVFLAGYPRGLRFDAVVGRRTETSRRTWLSYWQHSLEVGSPDCQRLQEAIRWAGVMVAMGVTEREPVGGSLYCTLLYFGPDGQLLGRHRKLKPTGLERYIWAEGGGDSLVCFDTKLGRVGGLICWENYMPLARAALYRQGVEVYLAPTADARDSWQSTVQHIALEGRCFVLSSNQYVTKADYPSCYQDDLGAEPWIMSPGGSVIVSPLGKVLAGPLWNAEGLLIADLNGDDLIKSKLDFDSIGHYARDDVFQLAVVNQPPISKL